MCFIRFIINLQKILLILELFQILFVIVNNTINYTKTPYLNTVLIRKYDNVLIVFTTYQSLI